MTPESSFALPSVILLLVVGRQQNNQRLISCKTYEGASWDFYVTDTSIGDIDTWPDSKMTCEVTASTLLPFGTGIDMAVL